MNKLQAKAIHNEIKSLYYNKKAVEVLEREIEELDERIESLNRPHSPVWDKVSCETHVDKERAMLVLITDKEKKERDKKHFSDLVKLAESKQADVQKGLEHSEWLFLKEYFSAKNKQEVGYKYGYSNAHEIAVQFIQKSDISKI